MMPQQQLPPQMMQAAQPQPQMMPQQPPVVQPGQPQMMMEPTAMQAPAPVMAEPAGQQPPMQAIVKQEIGPWQICEDAQGDYFVYLPSGQTFDNMPPELLQLLQQQGQA